MTILEKSLNGNPSIQKKDLRLLISVPAVFSQVEPNQRELRISFPCERQSVHHDPCLEKVPTFSSTRKSLCVSLLCDCGFCCCCFVVNLISSLLLRFVIWCVLLFAVVFFDLLCFVICRCVLWFVVAICCYAKTVLVNIGLLVISINFVFCLEWKLPPIWSSDFLQDTWIEN